MSKKVLLFDDDEDILSICAYVLTNLGWEVHTRMDCNNILTHLKL